MKLTDEEKAKVVERYMNPDLQLSAADLAKEFGCSTPTMLRHLKSWGAIIRGKGRIKNKVSTDTKNSTPKVTAPKVVTEEVIESTSEVTEEYVDSINAFYDKLYDTP